MLTLPSLVLTPTERETYWDLKFMFPSNEHSNAFHWVGGVFVGTDVLRFMVDWANGPEECIKTRLDLEPPSGKWWRLPPRRDAPDAEPETAKAAEELDL